MAFVIKERAVYAIGWFKRIHKYRRKITKKRDIL